MPSYGGYQSVSDNSSQRFPVQQPVRARDSWHTGLTSAAANTTTPQKRRHACVYNGAWSEISSTAETQTIVPRPMSMQSQFSQQLVMRDANEPIQSAQPSLGMPISPSLRDHLQNECIDRRLTVHGRFMGPKTV